MSALLFRGYFYIMLRMNEMEDLKLLENWDPIGPDLVLLMSIEEVVQNFVLLCYFFGVTDKLTKGEGDDAINQENDEDFDL